MEKHHYSILFTIIGFLHLTNGCSIDGVNWLVPVTRPVLDTYRGEVFSEQTQDIQAITTVTQREGLNEGPYFDVKLENSLLIITTNANFNKYEEIETQTTLGYTITLRCTDSTTKNLVFVINLTDTNNNDPIFMPTNDYEFTIAPPVPPGFLITTCLNDILVRDIDLTTQRIDFEIEGSDLFEISFDPSSQVPKEFKASLKTTGLIRSIAAPIKLTVTATDVDLTEGPPRTASATVVIAADSQFQFPDEPIFSQPFYLANYNSDNDVILEDTIFLTQGYDKDVKFSFESDHSEYFDLFIDQNNLSFNIKAPIPVRLYDERQIYLIVKATREHTSGATATVILRLPEVTRLEFENSIYEGTITDNVLQLTDLKLKQGYEGLDITVDVESEYTFRANVEANEIKISMDPLPADVIQNNNFINLQVTASNNRTTAVALVILEIIKDDYTTPVFENNFYSGSYSTETGLTLEQIVVTQGFDKTVKITLEGEHFEYFKINQDGPTITLTASTIPPDIFNERNIIISVIASKPRTVGAQTAVKIALPSVTHLEFENSIYEGTITDNVLQLTDLKLKQGYEGLDVTVDVESEYTFRANVEANVIKISMDPLPTDVIQNNNFINLQVTASNNRTTAITVVTLEIIKDDYTTPVFENNLYSGSYSTETGLTLEQIVLTQGFDKTVKITLEGEHFEYFKINQDGPRITLTSSTIPPDIFNERNIIISVIASKPRTVGAQTAVKIALPSARYLDFEENLCGSIESNKLTLNNIVLIDGYEPEVNFTLISATIHDLFSVKNDENIVSIKIEKGMPESVLFHVNVLVSTVSESGINALLTSTGPPENDNASFDRILYYGELRDGVLSHDNITLSGYNGTNIQMSGEHNALFISELTNGAVKVETAGAEFPRDLTYISLELQAASAKAILLIDVSFSGPPENDNASFDRILYYGQLRDGVFSHDNITLSGYNGTNIQMSGEHNALFISELTNGAVKVETAGAEFPRDLTYISLELQAASAKAILLIDVSFSGPPENDNASFDRILYYGQLRDGIFSHDNITLSGYNGTNIQMSGEHNALFISELTNGAVKVETAGTEFPRDLTYISLELQAASAKAILLIDVSFSGPPENDNASFDRILYYGQLRDGVFSHDNITLSGYNGTNIQMSGEHNALFISELTNGAVKVETAGAEFPRDLTYISLELQAASAKAILLIDVSFSGPPENDNASFDRILYYGQLRDGVFSHDNITLSGYNGTNIQMSGEHNALFISELTNGAVKVETAGAEFPRDLTYISLELQAASAKAILLIDVSFSGPPENDNASFDRILYYGQLRDGVFSHDNITLSGYNGTNIQMSGEHNALFISELTNGAVKVETAGAEFPRDLTYISLELQAASAKAILLIDVSFSGPPENDNASFDRILYYGELRDGVFSHDNITLSGYNGTNIQMSGEHNALFISELTNGAVKVETAGAEFPRDLTYISLELQAASAKAILLIDVSFSENPQLPVVTFKSQSYFLWADVEQTGVVGTVEATADNGEAITYSLSDINEHIHSRININDNGEILLTAAFDKGVYKFNAVATSVQSQVQATAPVLLRVDTLPECSDDAGISPLIILERLEEEPHFNLVVLNQTEHRGCKYTLSNVFPKDQSWLYVDNDGLHTKAIDREDGSIAFMTLSQIQVELTLDCDSDEVPALNKRSLGTQDGSDLYSYDDGPNKWVFTDTITFNARRSFVNLIVNDINDNSPIFLGKGNEPIYVGYPVSELEGTVLPRALAELKATDADIGENAAIVYWSREDNLAVSPNTGLVHVRNNAQLENNSRLTIYAIDQNGKGRNGTIDIVVKLLDKNQIVVLTVRDAFLEDEADVLNELSKAVGYDIKVLKAVVIPNNNEELPRRKREVASNSRASLQLYVYGLLESEPVDINQLTRDINNVNVGTINIASIVSFEDHLGNLEIGPGSARDTGLLAATIALAVLLFIVIVAIAVWFFLIWKKTSKKYKQFSNRSSTESQLSSPNVPKIEVVPKPRPDIDEIKRTERRLQKMLETPIDNTLVSQADNNVKPPIPPVNDAKVNMSPDATLPIVIQSIDKLKDKTDESDDNDEFGEVKKPRKSVVTFNENVEKIIHIENVPDDNSSHNSLEVYKF